MSGPLSGIRVVELGFWVAGPAAGGILSDWGAEVVKLEPPAGGDPMRGIFHSSVGVAMPFNPPFELDNRGKRSIALDLKSDEGREIAHELIDRADVFLSNLRGPALASMGLDWETLHARNPKLVYCSITGYGTRGPEADRPAYDVGAFWSRAGVGTMLTSEGTEPPMQRGGMGDHTTGMTAAGAIAAALVARDRTGEGQHVETSLMRAGMYVIGWDVATRLRFGPGSVLPPSSRKVAPNPLVNSYRASCGTWFNLIGLQADRHWPDVCRALGRPDLEKDERCADTIIRRENAAWIIEQLEQEFAKRPLSEWAEVFERENVWWAPMQDCDGIAADEQMRAAGGVVPFDGAQGEPEQLNSPVDFHGTECEPAREAPELGQHTELILLELGYDWETIAKLKDSGAIL